MALFVDLLFTRLSTYAGLIAYVDNRIFPMLGPQGVTVPYVIYTLISQIRRSGMGEDSGIVTARYQFDVYHADFDLMSAIVDQVQLALQRWKNPTATPRVIDSFIDNRFYLYDGNTDLYQGVLDVIFHHGDL